GRHQDPHQDVVVGIADVVAGRLFADHQGLHVDGGHEVGGAEDQRFQSGRRRGDGVDVDEAAGGLDHRLDADPADFETGAALELSQRQIVPGDLLRGLDLGQDDGVEVRTGPLDDGDEVGVRPGGGQVVDPHGTGPLAPAAFVQTGDDDLPGPRLLGRGNGVLQVDEHLIGPQAASLVDHLGARAGYR